jgi:hypothetical protein
MSDPGPQDSQGDIIAFLENLDLRDPAIQRELIRVFASRFAHLIEFIPGEGTNHNRLKKVLIDILAGQDRFTNVTARRTP